MQAEPFDNRSNGLTDCMEAWGLTARLFSIILVRLVLFRDSNFGVCVFARPWLR